MPESWRPPSRVRTGWTSRESVVFGVVSAYWKEMQSVSDRDWPLREPPSEIGVSPVPAEAEEQAESIGRAAARLDVPDASYMIGVLYTGMMPARFRARLGAYYTPPALCERLLDMATEAGVDWRSARVLDPACGGGAFLAPVARRMAESHRREQPQDRAHEHSSPFERFRAGPVCGMDVASVPRGDARRPVQRGRDTAAFRCACARQPPAGARRQKALNLWSAIRLTDASSCRRSCARRFRRSLFGHANLYGVFTDLALRFTGPGGIIAYVTPTSFLSGEYFKALRRSAGAGSATGEH